MSLVSRRRSVSTSPVRHIRLPIEGICWLVAIAGLWVTGWIKGINLILLLAYLLLALWILNWLAARRSLRGLAAKRISLGPIFARTPSPWHVEVTDQGRQPLSGWELIDDGSAHSARWFVVSLGPGQSVRLRDDLNFAHRGTHECKPLRAVCSYPFGLVRQEVRFDDEERVLVYPAVGNINLSRLRRWLMQASRPDERHRRNRRRITQEVEFHGLRSFRPGDSPRWIHWRTSARRGELMVREFDQGTHYDLLLILEAFESQ